MILSSCVTHNNGSLELFGHCVKSMRIAACATHKSAPLVLIRTLLIYLFKSCFSLIQQG